MKILRHILLGLIIVIVIILSAWGILVYKKSHEPVVVRGPVWDAIELTLTYDQSNPVIEDIEERGLIDLGKHGYIRVGEIEELVKEKVYVIDDQGYLQFGPKYQPPSSSVNSSISK